MVTLEKPTHAPSTPGQCTDAAGIRAPVIAPPDEDDRLLVLPGPDSPALRSGPVAVFVIALVALAGAGAAAWHGLPGFAQGAFRVDDTRMVARRIVQVESNGCASATNDRSSAAGPAQFIEETWLRLIRKYRPDLAERPRSEILAMRHDPDLSSEMASRFADQNATVLRKHGFPITSGALYLSHFAGVAGAVAILSAQDTDDAALTMANADATGRVTRDLIVGANPFLEDYSISDLKKWADRKMQRKPGRRNTVC